MQSRWCGDLQRLGQCCMVRGFIRAGLTTALVTDRLASPVTPEGGGIGKGILCSSNSQV